MTQDDVTGLQKQLDRIEGEFKEHESDFKDFSTKIDTSLKKLHRRINDAIDMIDDRFDPKGADTVKYDDLIRQYRQVQEILPDLVMSAQVIKSVKSKVITLISYSVIGLIVITALIYGYLLVKE